MAAEEPTDEGYEQLVRQQLDALGYDSAAIPDDVRAPNMNLHMCPVTRLFCKRLQVLRAFLKDFDNKMEIQEESSATEAPGAPPVAAFAATPSPPPPRRAGLPIKSCSGVAGKAPLEPPPPTGPLKCARGIGIRATSGEG